MCVHLVILENIYISRFTYDLFGKVLIIYLSLYFVFCSVFPPPLQFNPSWSYISFSFFFQVLHTCSSPLSFLESSHPWSLTSMGIPNETHISQDSKLTITNGRIHMIFVDHSEWLYPVQSVCGQISEFHFLLIAEYHSISKHIICLLPIHQVKDI